MLHIAMYPWFAVGHITPFLHISNKLAERGNRISFIIPTKTRLKFEPSNLHPNLITFIPIEVPCTNGLPLGTETTSDVPFTFHWGLMSAMDLTAPVIESLLLDLKPDYVFFDFAHWIPSLSNKVGFKSVHYCSTSAATVGYLLTPERILNEKHLTVDDLMEPPPGFPPSSIRLRSHEAKVMAASNLKKPDDGVTFIERLLISFQQCDAICFKTCREIEGPFCDYVENQFKNPVITAGPVVPESTSMVLEEGLCKFLNTFKPKTVVFCVLGSECILGKSQIQELVLGFELTGLPFLVALKPPSESETIESVLPDGFKERVEGRGHVHEGWVQQKLILQHSSIGCFVTHCGSGSLSEAMVSDCQIILMPQVGDQYINARLMGEVLRVGVEVEKDEIDGRFTKDGVEKAVKAVMDDDSEVGKEVKTNHAKWKDFLLTKGLEKSYIDDLVKKLHELLGVVDSSFHNAVEK